VLAAAGWDSVHARAAGLAAMLARALADAGHEVLPRGNTTLVTWRADDAAAGRERATERGILIRDIPNQPWLRASTGAWNDENDLQQLLDAL
jgi:selenocysteine lyase/cysteine desulfurase